MKKALIFRGGWDGHEPKLVSERFARLLQKNGIHAEIFDGVECLAEQDLLQYDLLVACVTMSEISKEAVKAVSDAVSQGVGLAGCHGGMCDAFRQSTEWQFMTGGQWVSHPGSDGVEYTVNICHGANPITEGLEDFKVCSEHYYLHIDPAIEVLATTRFPLVNYRHASNKPVDMPVAWTKFWGLGRVFYCSLGHHDDVFDRSPNAEVLMERGMVWAAGGKQYAEEHRLDPTVYDNKAKMY
ncbi:MAG: ThuA domain-containing protein [Clostridia bacterium]|nr:ThuA domain-containing protein [Clostridia bacterium]